MARTAQPIYRDTLRVLIFAFVGLLFLFQSSCAEFKVALEKVEQRLRQANASETTLFQSKDFIVYRVQHDDSPAGIAEKFLGDKNRSWIIEEANEGIVFREGQTIKIPLKAENKGGLKKDGYQVVPILSYHHFAEDCKSNLCMPVRTFQEHLRYLKENRYSVITMGELIGFLKYRHAIPKRSVVITIDDGYSSAYHIAYPILKQYGFTAVLFIYTEYIGVSESAINWDQLREMKANGFEVGSHTLSHVDLTKKRVDESHQAYLKRVREELMVSKQIIDKELQQNTMSLAYPFGRYNETILKTL